MQPPVHKLLVRSQNQVLPATSPEDTEPNFLAENEASEKVIDGFSVLGTQGTRSIVSRPWRWSLSKVQHLPWSASQQKKWHLFDALVFHSSLAPDKAIYPRKEVEYAELAE
jgi:hypothetical protein